jgi:NAD(P)-dependent dehydrogenase (short-subunit alcohol dehydrogenase family)
MPSLTEVRAHNTTLQSLGPNLVAIFVGGTSGIGLSTARELVRNTQSPHVYLIGRNQPEAQHIINELQTLNPTSKLDFIKADVSLLKNVDEACRQIKEKEQKINLLFMTAGYFTLQGRDETVEGLDRKFSLHYYARMRFIHNLSPLLTAAANSPDAATNLSRVVSVLDPKIGRAATTLNFSDLSLKNNFTLKKCADHTTAMNNYALEYFAETLPGTSFIHAYPSLVPTNLRREVPGVMGTVLSVVSAMLKPVSVDITESGERHLYAATAPRFAPRGKTEGVEGVARGSDEVVGSGAYNLNWDDEVLGESRTAARLRSEGVVDRIWKHTEEVFGKICEGEGKY